MTVKVHSVYRRHDRQGDSLRNFSRAALWVWSSAVKFEGFYLRNLLNNVNEIGGLIEINKQQRMLIAVYVFHINTNIINETESIYR